MNGILKRDRDSCLLVVLPHIREKRFLQVRELSGNFELVYHVETPRPFINPLEIATDLWDFA